MSEFVFCVIFCSITSAFLYLIGVCLVECRAKGKRFQEIYCFLHMYALFLPLLLLTSVLLMNYIAENPGYFLLTVQSKHMSTILQVLFKVWAIGAVLQMIWFIVKWSRFRRQCAVSYKADHDIQHMSDNIAKELKLSRMPTVKMGEELISAYLVDGRKPVIYLPAMDFTEVQIKSLLTHELIHCKYGDSWFRRLSMMLYIIFWFNPVLRILLQSQDYWDELHCDYETCRTPWISELDYSDTIYMIATRKKQVEKQVLFYPGFLARKKKRILSRRVDGIMNWKSVRKLNRGIIAVMACSMIFVGTGISVLAATAFNQLNNLDLNRTDLGVMENLEQEVLIEYEMSADEMKNEIGAMADAEIQASPNGAISATLNNNTWRSGTFSAKSGQTIAVSITAATPTSVTINAGIIEPDGTWRWVNGSGSFNHTFSLDQTGTYQVFVRNKTTTTVNVYGAYATYTAD